MRHEFKTKQATLININTSYEYVFNDKFCIFDGPMFLQGETCWVVMSTGKE